MPYFVILDNTANLVESYDREDEARRALEEIVRQDPESADEYAIIPYDDRGHPIGEALVGSEVNTRV